MPPRTPQTRASRGRKRGGNAARLENRKVDGAGKRARAPKDPAERRARNRTILALGVLAAINAYVFLGRGDTSLSGLGVGAAAIEDRSGPLPPWAEPPADACGGDPVRIFEGLSLIPLQTALTGGTTLRLGLLALGIASEEIDRVEASVRTHVDLTLLGGSGAPLRVAIDRHGAVQALEIELAEGHILQACRSGDEASTLQVRNIQHPLRTDVEVLGIGIGADADLGHAVRDVGEKPELADLIARTLASDVDFMLETRPGDRIEVLVEKRWLGRRFHRYGQVMAVRFVGNAARVAYYRYKPEGAPPAFFDAEGAPVRRALLRSPIPYFPVDPEARGLLAPSIEVVQGRIGAVYRVPEGVPVVSLGDGEVIAVARDASDGHVLSLRFEDGTVARYAHLMRVVGELAAGTKVAQGQIVGLAGHSGRTPNDRLRLELTGPTDGKPVDPLVMLARTSHRAAVVGAPIPEAQRKRFADDIAPWNRALKLAR
ncbi:MAG: M23 family metallopeptidase [Deltaproteobacteria bacterium]|nr:M23 family metallopeptidase [Deltaproteobacteria bacterium]